jgi:hypothetical protein
MSVTKIVHRFEGGSNLRCDRDRFVHGDRPTCDAIGESLALRTLDDSARRSAVSSSPYTPAM